MCFKKLAFFCCFVSASLLLADSPNVILILTDDQGYGDLAAHGHPQLKTPHLDRLRAESVRFENFYVSPSCSPTRAALLTGMHEFRGGVTHTKLGREKLSLEAKILPQLLKKSGYRTGCIGKWHLGNDKPHAPSSRGFDWVSINVGGGKTHFDPVMNRNGKRTPRKGFREDLFFEEAMAFIEEGGDEPFFCYLATFSPHTPLAAPEEDIAPYREGLSEKHAAYLGMIANIDKNVGRLLAFLDEKKLAENTVVIFMNDNGVTEGLDLYNAGMRGSKCTIWEGGSRAMSFWRWPKKWIPHEVNNLTAHLDVVPTLCELAGVEVEPMLQEKLEGFSLLPLLESPESLKWQPNRMLFHHVARWPTGLAASHKYAMAGVRQGDLLLLRSLPCEDPACMKESSQCQTLRRVRKGIKKATYTEENAQFHWGLSAPGRWSLYDVKKDPECLQDLASGKKKSVAALSKAYEGWWGEVYPEMIAAGGDQAGK